MASLVVCALLVMVSPLGKQVSEGIKGQADSLSTVASTSIEGVGVPSTLGYKPKDVVEIGGKNYVILQDRGSNRYLVMDINGIGKREFNTDGNGQDPNKCKYDSATGRWSYETCNNQYEGSNIDQYLNGEYYDSLAKEIKNSIVSVNIQQNYYDFAQSNPEYKWVSEGDANHNGCDNTACVLQDSGKWVPWEQHKPVKGKMGAYKFDYKGDMNNLCYRANIIKRRIFLPSVKEVSSIVNVLDQWEMSKFLKDENGAYLHMWFRDGRYSDKSSAMYGSYYYRSLNNPHIRYMSITVRPTFVIDLEAYQQTQAN